MTIELATMDELDVSSAEGDRMASEAEMHYWFTIQDMAELLVSYGYHRTMADLTEVLNDKIARIDESGSWFYSGVTDNSRLCDVQHWASATRGPEREEARVNDRLIAAAPELLASLNRIQDAIQTFIEEGLRPTESVMRHWQADARAAIAKATGETK